VTVAHRTLVIVNPRSSGGGTSRRWRKLAGRLDDVFSDWSHAFTERPGHATELCRDALKSGVEMIVSVGGDGTINEVVNGFFDGDDPVCEQPILGLLPSGTGGDFRKTWGLSRDANEAIERLKNGALRPVDVGRVRWTGDDGTPQMRYFANIASFGMSALVCVGVNQSGKRLGGRLAFMEASVRALLKYKPGTLRFDTDGTSRTEPVTVGAVAVGRFFGGGMMVAPDAEPNDGNFDVVAMGLGKLDLARMRSIYTGTHLSNPRISHWRGAAVDVEVATGGKVYIEGDGEVFGHLPARFETVPSAYRIKV
jgi:YegS/Rv2252/BmrU family lipid kinase